MCKAEAKVEETKKNPDETNNPPEKDIKKEGNANDVSNKATLKDLFKNKEGKKKKRATKNKHGEYCTI